MTIAETDAGTVRIRTAAQADLLDVFRIERASFPQPWPFAAFERYLDEPGFLVAVPADESETVVGYVVADSVPNHGHPLGHVKDLAVHPEYRGRGIGAQLLEHALFVLATNGVDVVKLEVREDNRAALSLYRAFGFSHHHTVPRYYDDGENALVMVRRSA